MSDQATPKEVQQYMDEMIRTIEKVKDNLQKNIDKSKNKIGVKIK